MAKVRLIALGTVCLLVLLAAGVVGKVLGFLAWAIDVGLARLVDFLSEHCEELE